MAFRDVRYVAVREKLNSLEYNYPLSMESVPLVEVLLTDLYIAKERLKKQIDVNQDSQEKCQSLERKVNYLEEEMSKAVSENRHLQQKMEQSTAQYEQCLKGLRKHIAELENNYSGLEFTNLGLDMKIGSLEETILLQNEKLMKYDSLPRNIQKSGSNILSAKNALVAGNCRSDVRNPAFNTISEVNNYISDVLSHRTPNELAQNVETLKAERVNLASSIDLCKKQLQSQDEEIKRILNNLELPIVRDVGLFDELNNQLQLSVNKTLALAEAINTLKNKERKEPRGAIPFRNERLACICEQVIKLQGFLNECGCQNINFTEQRLRIRVLELMKACDSLSKENEELKKVIEGHKHKGRSRSINDFKIVSSKFKSLKCCADVHNEVMSLRNENIALNKLNNSLRKAIEHTKQDSGTGYTSKANDARYESTTRIIPQLKPGGNKKCNEKGHDNIPKESSFSKHDIPGKHKADSSAAITLPEYEDNIKSLLGDLEKLKFERDYYCKECCILQDKLLKTSHSKMTFPEQQRSTKEADVVELQEKLTAYGNEIMALQQNLQCERSQRKMDNMRSQDRIKSLEHETNNSLCKQGEMMNRIQFLEGTAESLNEKIQEMLNERSFWQSECNKIRSINEHLEIKIKNAEAVHQKINQELNCALQHIKTLELEKKDLIAEMSSARQELQSKNEKLMILVKEKDNLMEKLDTQTIELHKIDQEKRQQFCLINQLEQKISRLNCQALRSNNEESRIEEEIKELKNDLQTCLTERNKLFQEQRAMQSDLSALVADNQIKNQENECYRKEILKLKEQLQNYVEEVRRVEQMLEAKEAEREEMLEQFKTLSAEAMHLETNNQTLECENSNLRIAQEKLLDLETTVQQKESIVCSLEEQIMKITSDFHQLKDELTSLQHENSLLRDELEDSQAVIKSIGHSKQIYQKEVHTLEEKIDQVNAGVSETNSLKEMLTSQVEEQKNVISSLKSTVTASRKEAYEQALENFKTQQKVEEMENKVKKLQEELSIVNNALLKCQETCTECKNENLNLKRELVQEELENFKAHGSQSFSTSL